jgi:16S rRNA (cytosine967-C5)-methyltransferase
LAERSRWAPGAAALAAAARVVADVAFAGRSADDALEAATTDSAERPAARAISLGSLRWYLRLAPAIDRLVSRGTRLDELIRGLLIVAAHQIEYSRNPPELTAHAAVDATRILQLGRASGLVNAVLRRFVRERVPASLDSKIEVRTAHPRWLIEQLSQSWAAQLDSILEADNAHPPLVLRLDLARTSVPLYLQQLSHAGMPGSALPWAPAAVRIEQPVPVGALPGFADGMVSVQDAGAQMAAPLLAAAEGMRVLDACAAPGGKTGHLLERTPNLGELVAIDVDHGRIARIQENLGRLGRTAHLISADVRYPDTFWDGRPFDRVLVDAPCSSTGVIRRHPDIKLLRRAADIASLARLQLQIVQASFAMLAPGGRLLYSTCSLLPAENDGVVGAFLGLEPTARSGPNGAAELVPGSVRTTHGVQLLPGAQAGSDGFYYACLEKTTTGT